MLGSTDSSNGTSLLLPTGVSVGTLFGISWSDWVLILTAVYTLMQIGDWVYTKIKIWRASKREHA